MFKLLALFSLAIAPHVVFPQNIITVTQPGGGASTVYTDIQTAIDSATSGSEITISGGGFGQIFIDKKLTIIGNGYDQDSSSAVGITMVPLITFLANSSGSRVSGLRANSIVLGIYGNEELSNIKISRCYVNVAITGNCNLRYSIFEENIIAGSVDISWSGGNPYSFYISNSNVPIKATNILFKNNIFVSKLSVIENSEFSNNIFLGGSVSATNCLFKNNIAYPFYCSFCPILYPSNSFFYNNVGMGANGVNTTYNNQGSGNFLNEDYPTLFSNYNYPQSVGVTADADFHITKTYLNTGGTDSKPIGIYGGLTPWKEGALPTNPHIQSKTIAPATDAQGKLNVNIRVKAQGN